MIDNTDELIDEAYYAMIDITLRKNGKRSYNQQKRAYEAWFAKYLPLLKARGFHDEELPMRRNIAGWLIHEAFDARRPARVFEQLVHELETLGWDDLENKSLKIGVVCAYFAKRMWKREGLRYLLPLKREIQQEYARTGEQTWANVLRRLAWLEERLRARSRPF